jgi:glutathione synthase/RimK-type ligase-like ATP-grasp enzyme
MQVCYDKLQATRLAEAERVHCPASALGNAPEALAFPLVVKPRRGSDSLGLRVLHKAPLPARYRTREYIVQQPYAAPKSPLA